MSSTIAPSKISLRPYQRDMVNATYDYIRAGVKHIIVIADTGAGKAQPLTSRILTPGGFKQMGELSVGDLVTGRNGQPTRITGIFPQGMKSVYRLTMTDGSSTLCCDDHLWAVQSPGDRNKKGREAWRILPVSKIRETYIEKIKANKRCTSGQRLKWFIPMLSAPVEFFPMKEPLNLDPYALGVLLGDGCFSTDGRVTFSCPDVEIQESLRTLLPAPCTLKLSDLDRDFDFVVTGQGKNKKHPLLEILRSFGLMGHRSEAKFVPQEYMYASVVDRLSLLQGLFDTDGYAVGSGLIEYVTTSQKLSEQVREIVQGLGGTVSVSLKRPKFTYRGEQKEGQLAYRMTVKLPTEMKPFRLTRKAQKYDSTNQDRYVARRGISNIEYVGEQKCQCISVEAEDHLYVTDNYIVTHNTVISSKIMQDAACKAKVPGKILFLVDQDCLLDQTAAQLAKWGVRSTIVQADRQIDWYSQVFVTSCQTLESWIRKGDDLYDLFGFVRLVLADECHTTAYRQAYKTLRETYTGETVFIGLTGTPYRTSANEYLGQWFDRAVEGPQPPQLIATGFIVKARCYSPTGIFDLTELDKGLRPSDDDYNEAKLSKMATSDNSLQATVNAYIDKGEGKPFAAYCVSVDHARKLAQKFRENGFSVEHQDGNTHKKIRESQDDRLRSGELRGICSMGTLTTGWDNPIVGTIILARAFGPKCKALFKQCAGRGCRTHGVLLPHYPEGKSYYNLIDLGGNLDKFGSPSDYQDYSIDPKPPAKPGQQITSKACPICGTENRIFAGLCSCCDYEFSKPDEADYHLPEDLSLAEWFSNEEVLKVRWLRIAMRKAWATRHDPEPVRPGKALFDFSKKFGHTAPWEWCRGAIFGDNPTEENRAEFRAWLARCNYAEIQIQNCMRSEFGDPAAPQKKRKPPKAKSTAGYKNKGSKQQLKVC